VPACACRHQRQHFAAPRRRPVCRWRKWGPSGSLPASAASKLAMRPTCFWVMPVQAASRSQVMGFGNFSSRGETDMLLRNVATGGVEVYNIANNQITGANFMGTVGLDWQFSGVGNFSGGGTSDLLLRNANTGGLEVYDIANNAITNAAFIGAVGLDWQ